MGVMMNGDEHIERGELAGFLYGELAAEWRAVVEGHLAGCAECREEVARWEAVRGELQGWRVVERHEARRPVWGRAWRVAAAVGLVAAGFAAARMTAPRGVSVDEMEARLVAERVERARLQTGMAAALQQMEARRVADSAALRRDIETVAVRTQAAFEQIVASAGPEEP
jgi:anti-sigma factor RsiW